MCAPLSQHRLEIERREEGPVLCAAGSVLYVGDHIRDIEAGNAAGMPTILAAYGYIPPEDQKKLKKWGADYIVETPEQLNKLLLSSGKFEYL